VGFRFLVDVVVAGEALARGHLPGCLCGECVAARSAVRGTAEVVTRAREVRAERQARESRRGFVPDPFPEAPRGPVRELGPGEELPDQAVVYIPPWGRR